VLAVVALARVLPAEDFGVFSLVYAGLTLFLGSSRAYFGIPLVLSAQGGAGNIARSYSLAFSGLLLLSLPIVGVLVGLGALASLGNSSELTILMVAVVSLATPLILLQDLARYYAIARSRPQSAVMSDGVWFLGAFALVLAGPMVGSSWTIAGWLAAIILSAVVAVAPTRPAIDLLGGRRNLIPKRGIRESVLGSALLSSGTGLLVAVLVAPAFGIAGVGSIRGIGTLFGPMNTMIAFLDFAVLGALVKRDRSKDSRSMSFLLLLIIGVTAIWGLLLFLIPQNVGEAVLGETWVGARVLLPVVLLEYIFLALVAVMALVLKARGLSWAIFSNKILSSGTILIGVSAAVLFADNLIWVSAGIAFGAFVGTTALARSTIRALRIT
jgi:O-antigen/teichoic acid export membrane protein